jgi:hypothetical protein
MCLPHASGKRVLEPYPRKTVLDEACLTDQAKQTLDIFPGPYQTIPYSDIDFSVPAAM